MNRTLFLLIALAVGTIPFVASSNADPSAGRIEPVKLSVVFKGVKNSKGKILVWLFNSEEGFPTNPKAAMKSISVTLAESAVPRVEILDLPPGFYAVAAAHDENDNQKLDTNFIGIPREGVAASRDAKGGMGPPKFRDAVLEISENKEIEVTFEY